MLIRLSILIVVASLITSALWPLERLFVFAVVLAVALPLFWVHGEEREPLLSSARPSKDNVVELDDYRRRKNSEKKKGLGQKNSERS
ncbi:MAG: hypothetical protein HQM13_16610 [SAR324 cluster bacterium]|nr:hypothetical protein [SAR324 cluster bacterium]